MLSVKKLYYKITEAIKTLQTDVTALKGDYITSKGVNGSWRYRKWHSGKIEAWATLTLSAKTPSVWVSPVRYIDETFTIPSGIFTSSPLISATSPSNQSWVVSAKSSSATAVAVRFGTMVSNSLTTYVTVYAWLN